MSEIDIIFVAVRKIFSVTNEYGTQRLHPNHWTSSDVIAKAIVENATDISEIIMAWSPVREHYDLLDLATQEAVKTAAKVVCARNYCQPWVNC